MIKFFFKRKIRKLITQFVLELYTFNREDQCWDIRITRANIDIDTMKLLVDRIVKG